MTELTNYEKIRRLPWQLAGNAFNMIFWVTAAYGSVFVLFLYELGLDKARIGILLSLLPFCGISAVFTAPYIARFGLKRTFLIFFAGRTLFAGGFLFTPLIIRHYEMGTAFLWVSCCIFGFALCRAIAETAIFPWAHEMIPDNIRGKFSGINSFLAQIVSIAVVAVSGYVIGRFEGINKFVYVIFGGVVAGICAVCCFFYVPGGKPVPYTASTGAHFKDMLLSLKDANFRCYMTGLATVSVGITALIAFIPLYMKQQIGLASNTVIWLDIGIYTGALLSSFMWGWAADRFGSKPVMLSGACLMVPIPVLCFLIPRQSPFVAEIAFCTAFLLGIATIAWGIGLGRYLYVSAVPAAKKTAYMAVFYAGAGLMGGSSPLLGGYLLSACAQIDARWAFFHIDAYTPFFLSSFILLVFGCIILNRLRSDGAMPMRRFVSIFLQGNPILAVGTLIRYYRVQDEETRVSITERLGYANNPLSNHELIAALNDPSFNVRYEAIIAVAHSRPDPELVDAMLMVLGSNEPELSVNAAWALGRMGDKSAIVALRETLYSDYSLLCARSARALATLGDSESIPYFVKRFVAETDPGIRIAYAQSLGKLRYCGNIESMMDFLQSLEEPILRSEMALAMARIIGNERHYMILWRQLKDDFDVVIVKAILMLKSSHPGVMATSSHVKTFTDQASSAFAHNDHKQGTSSLAMFVKALAALSSEPVLAAILPRCAENVEQFGSARPEYIVLSLHAAKAAFEQLDIQTGQLRLRPKEIVLDPLDLKI